MTTQYAVCHLERGAGNDSGMSCHIERKSADGKPHIPDNADESRTHLNREFIAFSDGVHNRTQAIQHRIETAGLKRKVGKNRILSWLGTGELPKLEKKVADKDRQIAALQKQLADMQKRYDNLKSDSLREHNSYQKEIDAATKRVAEWEARYNAEHNRAKELLRLAYPERYRLSSGAELVSGSIPNRMYPSLSITTLFHGNEFKNTSYNLPQNLLDKYDSGVMTLHELVNELFEPWEQVDESQHSLLAVALQTAAGGIPTPHVGTGAGGSSSDLPWNDNDKGKNQRPRSKGRR